MTAAPGSDGPGVFVNRCEASGWRNSALTDQERKLMQAISDQMGLKKGKRQQAMRDQDRERAMVRGVVYRSTLETALQHQVALSDAEQKQHAAEDLQRLTDVYERRVCRIGEAHAEAAAYMQQQQEARLAQEQRLSQLNELQVQRFQSAIMAVKAQKGAAKAQTQQQQQRRAEILRAEREKAQSFSADQADRAQAQKRRLQDLARQELERRKRSANGLSVDFRNTRLHEGAPGPAVVPAVVAAQVPVIPDPVVSAEEQEHRAAIERRRREMAAAEAEFRARERFIAAQAKLRADAQKQAVEAELAELAAQRLQAKKNALAAHRMRIQDQRKQQELQRVFEENFLPTAAALDDDLAPRALPAFLQPTPPPAAAAKGAAAALAPADLGAHLPRPPTVAVPPAGPGPRWSKGRTAPLGRNPPPLPAWPALAPEPAAPSREEVAVQTEPDLMSGSPDQERRRHPPQHAPQWLHDPNPQLQQHGLSGPNYPPQQPPPMPHQPSSTKTGDSAGQESTPYRQDGETRPYISSPTARRLAWPGPPESATDSQSPTRHGALSSPAGATGRGPVSGGREQGARRGEDLRIGGDRAETLTFTPGTHELESGEEDESEAWGDDTVERELERMKLELGIDGIDLRSSTTSLTSSISMPPARLGDSAQRAAAGRKAKEEAVVRAFSGSGAAQQGAGAGEAMQSSAAGGQAAQNMDASAGEEKQQQPPKGSLLQNLVTDQRLGTTAPKDFFQREKQDGRALGPAAESRPRGAGMGAAQAAAAARPPERMDAVTPAAPPPAGAAKGVIAPSPTDTLDSSILRLLNTPSSLASTPADAPRGQSAAAAASGHRGVNATRLDMTPGAASSLPSDLDDMLMLSELDWSELEGLAGLRDDGGAMGGGTSSVGTTPARGLRTGADAAAGVSPSTSTLSTVSGVSDESIRRLVAQGILPPEIAALLATTPSDISTVSASTPAQPSSRPARHEPSPAPVPTAAAVPHSPTASSSLSGLSALLATQATGPYGKHPTAPSLPATSDMASLQAASSLSSLSAYIAALPRGRPGTGTAAPAATAAAPEPHGHPQPGHAAGAGLCTIPEGRPVRAGAALNAAGPGAGARAFATQLADLSATASRLLGGPKTQGLGGPGPAATAGGTLSGLSEPVRLTLADLNRNLLAAAGATRKNNNNQPRQGTAAPSPTGRPAKPGPLIISSMDDPSIRKPMQPPGMMQPPPLLQPPRSHGASGTALPPQPQQQAPHQAPGLGAHGLSNVNTSDLSSMSSSLSLSPQRRARPREVDQPAAGPPKSGPMHDAAVGAAAAVPSLTATSDTSTLSGHGLDDVTSNTYTAATTPATTDATSREVGKSPYDMYDREAAKLANLMASIAASLRQSSQAVARAGKRQQPSAPTSPAAAAGGCGGAGGSSLLSGGTTPSSTLGSRHDNTGLSISSPSSWTLAPSSQGGLTIGTQSPVAALLRNTRAAPPGPKGSDGAAKAGREGTAVGVQGRGGAAGDRHGEDGLPSSRDNRPERAAAAPAPAQPAQQLHGGGVGGGARGGAVDPRTRSPVRAFPHSPTPTTPSSLSSPRLSSPAAHSPNEAGAGGASASSPLTTPTPTPPRHPSGKKGDAAKRGLRASLSASPGSTTTGSSALSLSSVLALIRQQQQGTHAVSGERHVAGGRATGSPGQTAARKVAAQHGGRSPGAERRKRRQQPTSPLRQTTPSPKTETTTRSPSTPLSLSPLRGQAASPRPGKPSPPNAFSPSLTESSFDSMALNSVTPLSAMTTALSEPAAAPQSQSQSQSFPRPLQQQQQEPPSELSSGIRSGASESQHLSGGRLLTSAGLSSIAAAIAEQMSRGGGDDSSSYTVSSASLANMTRTSAATGPPASAPMRGDPSAITEGYESPTSTREGSKQQSPPPRPQGQQASPQWEPMLMVPIAAQSPVRGQTAGPPGRRGDFAGNTHGSPNAPVDVWASLTGQSLEEALAGLITPASGQYDDLMRSSMALSISSTGLDDVGHEDEDDEEEAVDNRPSEVPPLPRLGQQQQPSHPGDALMPGMSSRGREEVMESNLGGQGSRVALSDASRSLEDVMRGRAWTSSVLQGGAANLPASPGGDRSDRHIVSGSGAPGMTTSGARSEEVEMGGWSEVKTAGSAAGLQARLGSSGIAEQLVREGGKAAFLGQERDVLSVEGAGVQDASSYELLAAADSLLAQAASSVVADSQAAGNLLTASNPLNGTTTTAVTANLPSAVDRQFQTSASIRDGRSSIPLELRSSGDSDEFGSIMAGLLQDIQRGLAALHVAPPPQPPLPSAPPGSGSQPSLSVDADLEQGQQLQGQQSLSLSPQKLTLPLSPQQKRPWEEMLGSQGQGLWDPATGPALNPAPDGLAAESQHGRTEVAGAVAFNSSALVLYEWPQQGVQPTGGSAAVEEPLGATGICKNPLGSSSMEIAACSNMEVVRTQGGDGGRRMDDRGSDAAGEAKLVGSGGILTQVLEEEGRQPHTAQPTQGLLPVSGRGPVGPKPFAIESAMKDLGLGETSDAAGLQQTASSDKGGRLGSGEQSSIVWWPDQPLFERSGSSGGDGGAGAGSGTGRPEVPEWVPYVDTFAPSAGARGGQGSAQEGESGLSQNSNASGDDDQPTQRLHELVSFPTFRNSFAEGLALQSPPRTPRSSQVSGAESFLQPDTATTTSRAVPSLTAIPSAGPSASASSIARHVSWGDSVTVDIPVLHSAFETQPLGALGVYRALQGPGPRPGVLDSNDTTPPRPPSHTPASFSQSHPSEPSSSALTPSGTYSFSQPPRASPSCSRLPHSVRSGGYTGSVESGGPSSSASVSSISSLGSITEALELARYPVFGGAAQSPMGSPSSQDSGSDIGGGALPAAAAAATAAAGGSTSTSTASGAGRHAQQLLTRRASLGTSIRVPIQFTPLQKPTSPPSPSEQEPWRGAWDPPPLPSSPRSPLRSPPLSPPRSPLGPAAGSTRVSIGSTTSSRGLQLPNLQIGSPPRAPTGREEAVPTASSRTGTIPLSQLRSPPSSTASSSMTTTFAAATQALEATAQGLQSLINRDPLALAAAAALAAAGSDSDSDLWMDMARWGLGTLQGQSLATDQQTMTGGRGAAVVAPQVPTPAEFGGSGDAGRQQPQQPQRGPQDSSQAVALGGYLPPEAFQDPDSWGEVRGGQRVNRVPGAAGAEGSTNGAPAASPPASGGRASLPAGWMGTAAAAEADATAAAAGEPHTPGRPERSSPKSSLQAEDSLFTRRSSSGEGGGANYAGALSEEQLAGLLMWTVSDFFSSPGSEDE